MAGASSAAASPTSVAPETIATERPGSSVVGWLVAAVVVAAGIAMSIAAGLSQHRKRALPRGTDRDPVVYNSPVRKGSA
jgi:hypothetical protein